MKLKVLGSNSNGNCYILENENEALIIECGISFTEIKKALDFNISKVVGCLITHEHKDHSKFASDISKASIDIYASKGTSEAMGVKTHLMEAGKVQAIGNFKVLAFDVMHDCAEPFGFLINHSETGNVLFATDTYYLPNTFNNLSNVIIECNYCIDILDKNIENGRIAGFLRDRTVESHMSYQTCKEALLANDLSKVNNIVLIHLSDSNSNAKEFQEGIYNATGKNVHVADKGLELEFNKTPF